MRTFTTGVLVAALLLTLTVASVSSGSAGPPGDGIDHEVNYTVSDGPGETTNAPGATNRSRYLYQTGYGHDFEVVDYITFVAPADQGNDCTTMDARAAGIDRNDDDPGTHTDVTFIGKYKEQINHTNSAGQGITTFDFYEEGSFAGDSASIFAPDQGILALEGCFTNPEIAGWYRSYYYVNGTNPDGTRIQVAGFSGWSYTCECSSYDEAVATIGPPPEEGPDGTMPDRDEGPWYLEEHRDDYDAGGGQATPTPGGTATRTVTAAPAMTTATPTPTATAAPSTPTATATTGTRTTQTSTPGEGETTPTETSAASGGAGDGDTGGSGPGFGVLAGLTAALAAALLARRRG